METTATFSNSLHSFYSKMILDRAFPQLKFKQFAKELTQPKGTGKVFSQLRYGNFDKTPTALTEGVPPTESTIDTNKYDITIAQYGDYIKITDLLKTTAIDPVMENISEAIADKAAITIDSLLRDELVSNATSNLQYVGSGNTVDNDISNTEVFVTQDVLKGIRALKAQDAPELSSGGFAWLVHPNISVDIMGDTSAGGWLELNKYVDGLAQKPLNGEMGRVYGARMVESSNVSSVANGSSVNVYRTFVLAKDALNMTKFDKNAIELFVKQPGSAGTADPLNQVGSVGYKINFGKKYMGGTFANANGASPDLAIQIRGTSSAN